MRQDIVDIERLIAFIESLREDVYVEKPSELHTHITDKVIETLFKEFPFLKEKKLWLQNSVGFSNFK